MTMSPSLAQVIKSFLKYELNDLNVAMPARILEYSNETQKATVQPIIKERYRDDKSTGEDKDKYGIVNADMPVIVGVPVVFPSANNGCITWPLNKGDTVQLIFNQRSLDLWLHTEDEKFSPKIINSEDNRTHDYNDAIAIPGLYPFKRALGSHPENFQIRYNVDTENEISMSMTPQGDLVFDVPGKVKWNCNGWEMFNSGSVREQHVGDITKRVDGDIRDDWNGNYELYQDGTTLERRAGAVTHDFLDSYSIGVELDIVRQSRTGNISDKALGDLLRKANGKIGDVSEGDWVVTAEGVADIESDSTMTFKHSGVLDLDGASVGDVPIIPNDVDEEPASGSGATFSPAIISFVVTKNSSFQYESKFFLIDNPEGPALLYQFVSSSVPNWLTMSRPILEEEDFSAGYSLNGLGQDIVVMDLNENTKDLPVGNYSDEIEVVDTDTLNVLFTISVLLEVRA